MNTGTNRATKQRGNTAQLLLVHCGRRLTVDRAAATGPQPVFYSIRCSSLLNVISSLWLSQTRDDDVCVSNVQWFIDLNQINVYLYEGNRKYKTAVDVSVIRREDFSVTEDPFTHWILFHFRSCNHLSLFCFVHHHVPFTSLSFQSADNPMGHSRWTEWRCSERSLLLVGALC